ISKLLVKKGDKVAVGQTLLILDGEGAAPAAEAPKAGRKEEPEPVAEEKTGQRPDVDTRDGDSTQDRIERTEEPDSVPGAVRLAPALIHAEDMVPAGPAVRRIARELGINLAQVQGSGRNG